MTEAELADIVGGASWWKEDLKTAFKAIEVFTPASLGAYNLPGPHLKK